VISYIETSLGCYACAPILCLHDFDSNVLCVLHFIIVRMHTMASRLEMCVVEIATNPQGYRVHADAVLKRYTPDHDQSTSGRYHISDHNFNLDISLSYGSVIRNNCQHSVQRLSANQYYSMIAS